jgi:two-component system sensor histidine kinase GlrK
MKLTTKVLLGFTLLLALITAILTYQVTTIERLQQSHRSLADLELRAVLLALGFIHNVEAIDAYSKKYLLLGHSGYAQRLGDLSTSLSVTLDDLEQMAAPSAALELEAVKEMWWTYEAVMQEYAAAGVPGEVDDVPPGLADALANLHTKAADLFAALQRHVEDDVNAASQHGETARRVFWGAGPVILLTGLLVSSLITRSVHKRLEELTAGARAVTDGDYSYQVHVPSGDTFRTLASDFNRMTERLRELDQLKKDLLAHVSHELKSPLASIQDTLQLAIGGRLGPLTNRQRRVFEMSLGSASRLSSMICNLLDLSRREAAVDSLHLAAHDLSPIVETVVSEVRPSARQRSIEFEINVGDDPVVADCDSDTIHQMVGNLLDNARKFSPQGSRVGVHLRKVNQPPSHLPSQWRPTINAVAGSSFALLSVTDHGPGIEDANKELIFEKFHQASAGRRLPGQGAGLGLAICRAIVKQHSGAIWVTDSATGGSAFYVLLPTAPEVGKPSEMLRL